MLDPSGDCRECWFIFPCVFPLRQMSGTGGETGGVRGGVTAVIAETAAVVTATAAGTTRPRHAGTNPPAPGAGSKVSPTAVF